MDDTFRFADAFGPSRIIHIHRPTVGLKAVVVVDNTACGVAIGGVRMAPDVTVEECFRLARAMTWKNAAAGLRHGGGKSVISADPRMAAADKESLIRAFAGAIGDIGDYVPGPDMGTDEFCMGWIKDETGRAVGLPRAVGGIPLDEIGATGFGVAACVDVAAGFIGFDLKGARVVVQGFGNVGSIAAQTLHAHGCRIVAASDSAGGVYRAEGLDPEDLLRHKQQTGALSGYRGSDAVTNADLLELPCDILVPAAMEGQITAENAPRIKARIIVEGSNGPTTSDADEILSERRVFVVPDILANAGGVIVSYFEWVQDLQSFFWSEEEINERLERIMVRSFRDVLAVSQEKQIELRTGALVRAVGRVADALLTRGIYP